MAIIRSIESLGRIKDEYMELNNNPNPNLSTSIGL